MQTVNLVFRSPVGVKYLALFGEEALKRLLEKASRFLLRVEVLSV